MPNADFVPTRSSYTRFDGQNARCPEGTIDCVNCGFVGMCFCEDHCSWKVCRLNQPLDECAAAGNSKWVWDSRNMHWVAQMTGTLLV